MRRNVNREFIMFGLDGVPAVDVQESEKALKKAINDISNSDFNQLKKVLKETSFQANEIKRIQKRKSLIETVSVILDLAGIVSLYWCPPCTGVLFVAAVIVSVSWMVYEKFVYAGPTDFDDGQIKFLKNVRAILEKISSKTKDEFQDASDNMLGSLFKEFADLIEQHYPAIRREQLL